MTDPMPTIENILGFPARTNTPDHRKIAENLLRESELVDNSELAKRWALQSQAHAALALAEQMQHLHDDLGAMFGVKN